MSLAFDLREDRGLRENNPLKPFKIVSLWDVLDFYADRFANICRLLGEICALPINGSYDNIELSQPVLDQLDWLGRTTNALRMKSPHANVNRLLRDLKSKNVANIQIRQRAQILLQSIIDEFEGQLILAIPTKNADYYRNETEIFDSSVMQRLPRIEEDAREARKAFAFERYSACAFHLMRIMEHVVQELADQLGVAFDTNTDTMGDIVAKIQAEVNKWDRGAPRPGIKKRKYNASCASMRGLVRRRNDIMHIRERYSEERATVLIGAVKACIEDYLKLPPP